MGANDAYFDDSIFDAGLNLIGAGTAMYLCSSVLAAGAAEATVAAASMSASPVTPTFGAIAEVTGPPKGRSIGVVTKDFVTNAAGNGLCIVITNGVNALYVQELSAAAVISSGQTWNMPAFTITMTDYDAV